MSQHKIFRLSAWELSASLTMAITLLFPALSRGQGAARDALHSFPAETQQMVHSSLAQLRALPEYPRIRQWIFAQRLRELESFLRSTGSDPEKDVDEVALGWRGDPSSAPFFGLAEGRLDPDRTHEYFVQRRRPFQQYAGYELYSSASDGDRADFFFVYFDSSAAAFGSLADIKTILDVRAGTHAALDSSSEFASAEAELEGTAPQWGIARGAAAASQAAPWLTAGAKLPVDLKAFLAPVK